MEVYQVSCGGSFTIAITKYNKPDKCSMLSKKQISSVVYSWGILSDGRLGIGNMNDLRKKFDRDSQASKGRIPIYRRRPTRLSSLDYSNIIDVSAGLSHALAVGEDGVVVAWGKNSAGQCSFSVCESNKRGNLKGHNSRGMWDDVFVPQKVPMFGVNNPARSVSAGSYHSAAVDSIGRVWTWGGGGQDFCLGHGSISSHRKSSNLNNFYDDSTQHLRSVLSGYLRLPPHASPRIVESLRGIRVKKVSLGEENGLVVTQQGHVYIWGIFDKNEVRSLWKEIKSIVLWFILDLSNMCFSQGLVEFKPQRDVYPVFSSNTTYTNLFPFIGRNKSI